MKILDSSVIIALFRKSELLHKKAVELFMQDENYLIPDDVLAEVLTVLKIRENFETAQKCANFLLNVEDIEIRETESEIFQKALDFFLNNKNRLSFIDTLILVLSREKELEVATFDKDLAKLLKT